MKPLPLPTYELLWMARRYADGRRTFSASTVNEIIDSLIKQGFDVPTDDTLSDPQGLYCTDGDLGFWRNGKFERE